MGTVYLGSHEVMPGVMRNIAVKLMHPEVRANRSVAPQLLQEARLAARIEHPNVVRMIEAGEEPEGVFLAMSYVEGATLADIISCCAKRKTRLPVSIALRILTDALTGLHAAHELRDESGEPLHLVHRDFSPQNILVGMDGITQLTDFGIAKATGQMDTTKSGVVKGKVGYMAPEQAMGKAIDRRCDVWAAGVVAWEALAGKRLFHAANDAAVLLEVVSPTQIAPLSDVHANLAGPLEEAVLAALVRDVDERLTTAADFRKRLGQAAAPSLGVAEAEDVADFVIEMVGEEIHQRRKRAKTIVELRDEEGEDAPTAVRLSQPALGLPDDELSTAVQRPSPDEVAAAVSSSGGVGAGSSADAGPELSLELEQPTEAEGPMEPAVGVPATANSAEAQPLLDSGDIAHLHEPTLPEEVPPSRSQYLVLIALALLLGALLGWVGTRWKKARSEPQTVGSMDGAENRGRPQLRRLHARPSRQTHAAFVR